MVCYLSSEDVQKDDLHVYPNPDIPSKALGATYC